MADVRQRIVNHNPALPHTLMGKARNLVACETRDTGAKTSICIFCRIDVGIRVDPFGQAPLAYFVNEVGRSLNTSIWLRFHDNTMGTLANTFAMVFKRWIMDIRNPYIV
ncbi:hypothetical protein JVT61DRAFT_14275 [Boletus reticuloceps]|uniref:Uncharacterized protein n=1 Tax=Boletus reticuloceps TaxID=495285 RepID=A0A8I2YCS8_9AGAM|nr:hypothetical protein JVT61DRAFT_14275 [Boletus reticuloceps]